MSRLAKDIRSNIKSGASLPAVVVDVFFGKASVRVLRNGQILRHLDVVGGPVSKGQQVSIDHTTSKPTVVVTGNPAPTPVNVNAQVSYPPVKVPLQTSSTGGGHTIQDEGTPLAQETALNFVGELVEATDDSGNGATVVTIDLPIYHNSTLVGNPSSINFEDNA